MSLKSINFYSPTKGRMNLKQVSREIAGFINDDPGKKYRVVVGTDSNGDQVEADFVTAITVHRIGQGGRYFWTHSAKKKIGGLKQKVYEEVNLSLVYAQELINELRKYKKEFEDLSQGFEIHIDVGQNGPTRDMIKEIVGMVRGNGFTAKTKPEAYTASIVADRYT